MKTIELPKKEKKQGRIASWWASCKENWETFVSGLKSLELLVEALALLHISLLLFTILKGWVNPQSMSLWTVYLAEFSVFTIGLKGTIELFKYFVRKG